MAGGETVCARCGHAPHAEWCAAPRGLHVLADGSALEYVCDCAGCPGCLGTGWAEIYDGGLDAYAEVRCPRGCEVAS